MSDTSFQQHSRLPLPSVQYSTTGFEDAWGQAKQAGQDLGIGQRRPER